MSISTITKVVKHSTDIISNVKNLASRSIRSLGASLIKEGALNLAESLAPTLKKVEGLDLKTLGSVLEITLGSLGRAEGEVIPSVIKIDVKALREFGQMSPTPTRVALAQRLTTEMAKNIAWEIARGKPISSIREELLRGVEELGKRGAIRDVEAVRRGVEKILEIGARIAKGEIPEESQLWALSPSAFAKISKSKLDFLKSIAKTNRGKAALLALTYALAGAPGFPVVVGLFSPYEMEEIERSLRRGDVSKLFAYGHRPITPPVDPEIEKRLLESIRVNTHAWAREYMKQFSNPEERKRLKTEIGRRLKKLSEQLCQLDKVVCSEFKAIYADFSAGKYDSVKEKLQEIANRFIKSSLNDKLNTLINRIKERCEKSNKDHKKLCEEVLKRLNYVSETINLESLDYAYELLRSIIQQVLRVDESAYDIAVDLLRELWELKNAVAGLKAAMDNLFIKLDLVKAFEKQDNALIGVAMSRFSNFAEEWVKSKASVLIRLYGDVPRSLTFGDLGDVLFRIDAGGIALNSKGVLWGSLVYEPGSIMDQALSKLHDVMSLTGSYTIHDLIDYIRSRVGKGVTNIYATYEDGKVKLFVEFNDGSKMELDAATIKALGTSADYSVAGSMPDIELPAP